MRGAWAGRLFMDQMDRMDLMDKMGAPRDNPWVCGAAVGWDAGGRCAAGVCGQCDGNGGVRAAAVWRLHKTYKTYKTYKIMIGAPLYTPWVCMSLAGLARVMICR